VNNFIFGVLVVIIVAGVTHGSFIFSHSFFDKFQFLRFTLMMMI